MASIVIKRVYDPPARGDGFRVLVDRLWPRGLAKRDAALDLWARDLAPSSDLRKKFNHRPERFAEFTRHYRRELSANPAVAAFRAELKRPKLTLLYGAHDPEHNQAVVLAAFLKKMRPAKSAAKKKARKAATKKAASGKRGQATAVARARSR